MKTFASPKTRGQVRLLVGTKKGAFFLRSDPARSTWRVAGPELLGSMVHHLVQDPRDRGVLLMAARTGHLGPTVFRSSDDGKTWREAKRPPAFRKAGPGERGRVVQHVFWLAPGHPSQPNAWYAGTSPQGLFRSEDAGESWDSVAGLNEHPMFETWTGGPQDGTPDGPKLHSVTIDPRDASHMYLGMSSGGVFESTDGGKDWKPLNKGCAPPYLPFPQEEFGHDPHCVRLHPLMPDRLYQQNHAGIYRMERSEAAWRRIGEKMPKAVGDIGFPMVLHPRDPDTVWVFPMDGTGVWPRTSPQGRPAVYRTNNAGMSWRRQDAGFPKKQAWLTVLRQAMTADAHDPVGLYAGTTTGDIWASPDEGESWRRIAEHLPHIYSVEVAAPR